MSRPRSASPAAAEPPDAALSALGGGDVRQLIAQLPPSEELLDYYRAKTDQFGRRLARLAGRLDECRAAADEAHRLRDLLAERDAEAAQLRQAVSDMQVYVFQERDHVLRLHAENDRLKIQEAEDRRKIDILLSLSGTTESSLTFFMKEMDETKLVRQQLPPNLQQFTKQLERSRKLKVGDSTDEDEAAAGADAASLRLQVDSLRAQLEERTRLAREERQALLDDRRVSAEERQAEIAKRDQKLAACNDKLRETQRLLYSATRDLLRLHAEHGQQERAWMAEKDQLLRERELLCQGAPTLRPAASRRELRPEPGRETERRPAGLASPAVLATGSFRTAYQKLRQRAEQLMSQLEEANTRCAGYREQCTRLEKTVSEVKDAREADRQEYKTRLSRLRESLVAMKARYDELERRRRLEAEGFRSDVRLLRGDLRALERRLARLTGHFFGDVEERTNKEVWAKMSQSLGNTAKILEEIRQAKGQIYHLERELTALWNAR